MSDCDGRHGSGDACVVDSRYDNNLQNNIGGSAMSASGAMSAAVSGLNASAYAVNVAANNIVNANTRGYQAKGVENKTQVTLQARLTGYASGGVHAVLVDRGNVDIGTEFIRMIAAQRAYESGVGVLKTADLMIRELVDITA